MTNLSVKLVTHDNSGAPLVWLREGPIPAKPTKLTFKYLKLSCACMTCIKNNFSKTLLVINFAKLTTHLLNLKMKQSASGQHGRYDGGHGHGCLEAGGKDRIFPLVAVLLLSRMTLSVRVVLATSRLFLSRVFSYSLSKFTLYIGHGEVPILPRGPLMAFNLF